MEDATIFAALLGMLAAFIAACVGLFSPRRVLPQWAGSPTRGKAVGGHLAASFALFIAAGMLAQEADQVTETATTAEGHIQAQASQPEEGAHAADQPETVAAATEADAPADQAGDQPTEEAAAEDPLQKAWEALDKSEAMQAKRESLIEELEQRGVVYRVEKPGQHPRVYVEPRWAALRFDERETFANMILAYFFAEDREADMLSIRDSRSGEEIAWYSYEYGMVRN